MRIALLAAARMIAVLPLFVPAAARAASPPTEPPSTFAEEMQRAAELMRQGLNEALGSVEMLLRAVPQYDVPQMDANGDIIIHRKRPSRPPADNDDQAI
jgi:hypothetical protein